MRVKKVIFFVAAFFACAWVLVLTSCGHNEEPTLQEVAISFNSTATDSRAVITDNAALQTACSSGEAIGVWGVVNNDINTNAMLFDNIELTYDGQWGYEPTRHWIRNAQHDFWALYPQSDDNCVFDVAAGTVTRSNITLGTTNAANNVDYMCAFSTRDLRLPDATTAPVPLDMTHALALLEFRFINALGQVSGVTNISLEGLVYRGSITFGRDGSLGGTRNGLVDIRVDKESAIVATGSNIYTGLCSTSPIPKNLSLSYNLFENVGGVVVMPQQVEGKNIMFNLKVGDSSSSINLGQLSPSEWEAGKKYIYTTTLTSTTIVCDVRVVDWVKDTVDLIP